MVDPHSIIPTSVMSCAISFAPLGRAVCPGARAGFGSLARSRAITRSPRAVLSSVMVVYFQSEVLTVEEEGSTTGSQQHEQGGLDPPAAALRNSSALILASLRAVRAALDPVTAGIPGARQV